MAIIASHDLGWLICHKTYLNRMYNTCIDLTTEKRSEFCVSVLDSIFHIENHFVMDSAARKLADKQSSSHTKRKREEDISDPLYNEIKDILENSLDQLIKMGKECNYINEGFLSSTEIKNNNSEAKAVAKVLNKNFLLEFCNEKNSGKFDKLKESLSDITTYPFDLPGISLFLGKKYIIPDRTRFLLGDLSQIENLIKNTKNKFDVILMDPPWFNKSIKRKKSYHMLRNEDLLNIPIPQLANSNCLVIVWVTNNQNQVHFIKEKLFPNWSVQYCADWHWIKITTHGSPVLPLHSHHKKPYENLIIGRFKSSKSNTELPAIPNHKVIISIPSSIHSHKPPLTEVLKPYVREDAECLELFARYLIPGWTSCGNEVLKLQDLNLFEVSKLK
ncbi:N(6)-adenine-specific methyltransferase METTL4 isoform X2 [Centruroides vittatus]|uniref:N(6)-adenine-specific methyltransferase METTL4 isoform X2 n=1 Tax=Centruroides vittatus TaxID=120091 RepID=UPI00351089A8